MPEPGAANSPPINKAAAVGDEKRPGHTGSARRPATSVTAVAAGGLDGQTLYAAARDEKLYARPLGEGGAWREIGGAVGVVALAILGDTSLYALDGQSRIWLLDL